MPKTSSIQILTLLVIVMLVGCNPDEYVTDVDGNKYPILEIGNAQWMGENLRVKRDRDGHPISFFFPNSDSSNVHEYGLLYDFEATDNSCPSGWRLPNNSEWEALFQFESENAASNYKDQNYWLGETNSNNTGFSARPAGIGNSAEHPNNFKENTLFWSIDKDQEHFIWTYILEVGKNKIRKASQHPTYGFSIRCIRE